MANTINNLSTSNTFSEWLAATSASISSLNRLMEGGSGTSFVANTNIDIANNVTIGGNLIVSGNITLDALGFDDLIVNGSGSFANSLSVTGNVTIANNLTVTQNTSLTNVIVTYGNFSNANVDILIGSANTAIYANIAAAGAAGFSGSSYANSAFAKANNEGGVNLTQNNNIGAASSYANSAFLVANTPTHVANSASSYANSAFASANNALDQSVAFAIALG